MGAARTGAPKGLLGAAGGIWIRGSRVIDPIAGRDEPADLFIKDGVIAEIAATRRRDDDFITGVNLPGGFRVIDAAGCVTVPGLIDLHVHFREPGDCNKEDIATGSLAAAKGGYTTVCCMPNTRPALDRREMIAYADRRGREVGLVNLLPVGALTKDRAGRELADFADMLDAPTRCFELIGKGICAVSDDGSTVQDTALMRRAAETAAALGLTIMDHPENQALSGGSVNEGLMSRRLGQRGIPALAEIDAVARDIALAEETGAHIHLQHISTRASTELIRAAKARGVRLSAETAPHYFALTEEALLKAGTNAKMNPPLRTESDRQAVIDALCDGTIEIIATDHAPHTEAEKALPTEDAPFGVTGLETAFAVAYTVLVRGGRMTLSDLLRCMSVNPARLIGLPRGSLLAGAAADLTVIDAERPYTVDCADFASKGKNSPFDGMRVFGKPRFTMRGGVLTWSDSLSAFMRRKGRL
ncbi:MAG: dihydroorotase [Clostridiales Family XIII bacterium]|jgi:dihydroorotase|nr:dihydroorotase [Clostridiales Family XIII bacterium]